jgi:hypothetical protein
LSGIPAISPARCFEGSAVYCDTISFAFGCGAAAMNRAIYFAAAIS